MHYFLSMDFKQINQSINKNKLSTYILRRCNTPSVQLQLQKRVPLWQNGLEFTCVLIQIWSLLAQGSTLKFQSFFPNCSAISTRAFTAEINCHKVVQYTSRSKNLINKSGIGIEGVHSVLSLQPITALLPWAIEFRIGIFNWAYWYLASPIQVTIMTSKKIKTSTP